MTTLFPGALDNFTDPVGTAMLGATTPKHSEHHANLNDAVEAIEAAVGITGSTDPASIEKRLTDVIDASAAAAADAISALAAAALVASDLSTLESSLGTAAYLDSGTAANNLVQLDGTGALPAVSAAALLDLPSGGVTDHGALTGLSDDDHGQYHNDARGDARYAPLAKGVTNGDAHDHAGGDGAQIAYSSLSGTPTLGTAAAASTGDFEAAGAVSTHNSVTTAHGISAFGATLVDDADAATARTTLVLGNVDNTSDANKPVSTAQQTALNLKANLASPTFTGTVSGITAAMVGAPSGSGTSTGTNTGDSATPAETTTTIGALINGATSKTTPVDADQIGLMDSAASNILKKLSWANIKATLAGAFYAINSKISVDSTSGTPSTVNAILSFRNTATNAGLQAGAATDYVWVRAADVLVAAYAQLKLGFGYVGFGSLATPHQVYLDTTTGNFSVGLGGGGSARLQSLATSEQLRLNYDAANYESSTTSSDGKTTKALVGTSPDIKWSVSDATTNALYDLATFSKNSTGAGAAGLGARINLAAKSSTTTDTLQGALSASWVDATHATRKARTRLWAADSTGLREGIRLEADGTQVLLGFYGGNAVAKPTALTATVAAAPAGGTGTAAGGWDTSGNRDLAIATINNLKTRVDQLETKLQALGLLT